MPGRLKGRFFKAVLSPMLSLSQGVFPDAKKRIDGMRDEDWYSWDDYKKLISEVAAKIPPAALMNIGFSITRSSKALYVSQGFVDEASILKDWAKLFTTNVEGAPSRDYPKTVSFEPGHVVIESSDAQPPSLIEGYIRGVLYSYGKNPTSVSVTPAKKSATPMMQFDFRWPVG